MQGRSSCSTERRSWKREGVSVDKSPVGTWQTVDDHWNKVKSVVEIRNVSGELIGSYPQDLLAADMRAPTLSARSAMAMSKIEKVVGMKIIWDFKKEGDKWVDGKILDPGNGNVYASSIWLIDSDSLKVLGYLGPFYRSQVWKRSRVKLSKLVSSLKSDKTMNWQSILNIVLAS